MRSSDDIKKYFKNATLSTNPETDQQVINQMLSASKKTTNNKSAIKLSKWRIIMTSKITKFAVAAIIIFAVTFSIMLFDKSIPTAYAIEQTIEAMRNIKTIYMHCKNWDGKEFGCWIKVNPVTGENDSHYVETEEEIMISMPEISYVYSKSKNIVRVINRPTINSGVRFGRFIEDMIAQAKPGQGNLNLKKSFDEGFQKEIIVADHKDSENEVQVIIDPDSKLPLRIDFIRCDINTQMLKTAESIQYDQPIPDELLDFEMPQDAEVVYEADLEKYLDDPNYGIVFEDSDWQQGCKEIVKQFWEALIDNNIETLRKLMPLVDKYKIAIEGLKEKSKNPVEVIEIGEPHDMFGCMIGPVVPSIIKTADGRKYELLLVIRIRQIEGKKSYVIYNQWGRAKELED